MNAACAFLLCLFQSSLWAEFGHIIRYYKLKAFLLPAFEDIGNREIACRFKANEITG